MIKRYDYISNCCNTAYSETRDENQSQIYPSCVQCRQGEYVLQLETELEDLSQSQAQETSENQNIINEIVEE
jgi:hypothetical protein